MKKEESPEERIERINKEFDEMLSKSQTTTKNLETPEKLAKFGLTFNEAKAWLKNEPNFSSDASYHEPKKDGKLTEPLNFCCGCFWL